ncbi:MAG: polysaccharide deacetylase family protein [Cyclobacteriaceae bacterium]|nr:polysaccharide deacetylase family protein [Cyclobacteriaceae bacterium]
MASTEPNYKEVVCFVYHRFGDNRFPTTNISINDFEEHLMWLTDHHYQVLSLSDAIDYLSNNTPVKKTAVISIDDGYKSFFNNGLPLLRQYKFPATLFINTETVGAGDYMDWQQLKEATEQKIEIGNHTHTHDYFLNRPPNVRYSDFENDLKSAQQLIKEKLGITSKVFAYPYGEFDKKMKTIVKSNGFQGAAAQNSGVMNSITDKYQIPRFPMSEHYAKMFYEKASMQSLKVIKKSPEENLIPNSTNKPLLTLTIDTKGLLMNQLQCFVQGGDCKINILNHNDRQMELTLQSMSDLTQRRRTLYTLTAPDSAGNWYWFSHLWVNPSVK